MSDILAPAVALMIWTMVMWAWMYATRIPAMQKAKVDVNRLVNDPDASLDRELPPQVQWKAHNYNHLHEQPTLFYIVTVILALTGPSALDVTLAWVYVALRIVHSLWQSLVNTIPVRLLIFAIGSIVLTVLAVRAVMATLLADPSLAPA